MRYIYILIIIFSLTSCFSNKAEYLSKDGNNQAKKTKVLATQFSPPSWYTNATYSSSDDFLYGYGSANTTKNAINSALADISSKLETTISTQTSLNINASNKSLDKQLSENISTSSKKIMFLGYNIINQEKIDGITYISISVNIPTLIKNLKDEIIKKQNSAEVNHTHSELDTFRFTQNLYSNTLYIKNAINTLELIDRKADLSKYIQIYNNQLNFLRMTSNKIKIYFNNINYPNFLYPPLKEYLQQMFVTTSSKSNADLYIKLTNNKFDESTDKLGNHKINASVKVTVKDARTSKILTKNFDIEVKSGFGRYDAITKLKQKFSNELSQLYSL